MTAKAIVKVREVFKSNGLY